MEAVAVYLNCEVSRNHAMCLLLEITTDFRESNIQIFLNGDVMLNGGCVCEVGTVSKISDFQPEGPRFKPRPGRGLNFGRPSFATPSVDRDVKPLV